MPYNLPPTALERLCYQIIHLFADNCPSLNRVLPIMTTTKIFCLSALLSVSVSLPVWAEQPQDFLGDFKAQAKQQDPGFTDFDAARGRQFFNSQHGADWSCSSCHTDNPLSAGKHIVTQKIIEPLAPAINAERFSNPSKVEKWFKRNCKDVVNRECTPQEKGDVLSYLLTLKP